MKKRRRENVNGLQQQLPRGGQWGTNGQNVTHEILQCVLPLKIIPFLSQQCDKERENTQRQHDTLAVLGDSELL